MLRFVAVLKSRQTIGQHFQVDIMMIAIIITIWLKFEMAAEAASTSALSRLKLLLKWEVKLEEAVEEEEDGKREPIWTVASFMPVEHQFNCSSLQLQCVHIHTQNTPSDAASCCSLLIDHLRMDPSATWNTSNWSPMIQLVFTVRTSFWPCHWIFLAPPKTQIWESF